MYRTLSKKALTLLPFKSRRACLASYTISVILLLDYFQKSPLSFTLFEALLVTKLGKGLHMCYIMIHILEPSVLYLLLHLDVIHKLSRIAIAVGSLNSHVLLQALLS